MKHGSSSSRDTSRPTTRSSPRSCWSGSSTTYSGSKRREASSGTDLPDLMRQITRGGLMTTTVNPRTVEVKLSPAECKIIVDAATEAYFKALIDQGRVFDHAELSMMIALSLEGAETSKFVEVERARL